jgi:hypothetical protein
VLQLVEQHVRLFGIVGHMLHSERKEKNLNFDSPDPFLFDCTRLSVNERQTTKVYTNQPKISAKGKHLPFSVVQLLSSDVGKNRFQGNTLRSLPVRTPNTLHTLFSFRIVSVVVAAIAG